MAASDPIRRRLDTGASLRAVIAVAVVTALVIVPVAAWASHQFGDVPNDHPFHAQIAAMKNAGIAGGFADGSFRPSQAVTRAQMAAFLERGVGRIARDDGSVIPAAGGSAGVAEVTIKAGAAGSGNGFVLVQGMVHANTYAEQFCPCALRIDVVIKDVQSLQRSWFDLGSVPNSLGYVAANGAVQAVVPVAAGSTTTFGLGVANLDDNANTITVEGTLTAQYFPLSGDGDNTL